MITLYKEADAAFSIPVSEKEKSDATKVRKDFEYVLKHLEEFDRYTNVFFDHLDDIGDKADFGKLNMLMKKFENKLKVKFKDFLEKLGQSLTSCNSLLSDTKMDNMRDQIIEAAKNMRVTILSLLKVFNKIRDPDFVSEAKTVYPTMVKVLDQMRRLIKIDLFGHIDENILGRIRIGEQRFPLVKRR